MKDTIEPVDVFKFSPRTGNAVKKKGGNCLVDSETEHEFYISPMPGVGVIIVNPQNEVLFAKRARDPGKGTWDIPGGFIDLDESAEEAAIREVKEEVGLEVIGLKFYKSYPTRYEYQGVNNYGIGIFFIAKVESFDDAYSGDDLEGDIQSFKIGEIPLDNIGLIDVKKVMTYFQEEYKAGVTL